MSPLSRRISKIEARCPAHKPVQLVDPSLLDSEVLAVWLAVDINHMTIAQLDMLEANLRKLA